MSELGLWYNVHCQRPGSAFLQNNVSCNGPPNRLLPCKNKVVDERPWVMKYIPTSLIACLLTAVALNVVRLQRQLVHVLLPDASTDEARNQKPLSNSHLQNDASLSLQVQQQPRQQKNTSEARYGGPSRSGAVLGFVLQHEPQNVPAIWIYRFWRTGR